jgi:hypothetical protein
MKIDKNFLGYFSCFCEISLSVRNKPNCGIIEGCSGLNGKPARKFATGAKKVHG